MSGTARPAAAANLPQPKDDGYFGPRSVSWRVVASSMMIISAGAAVLVEMLHPRVMRMIDQASTFRERPGTRIALTTDYTNTITYGDTEQAETAAATLRFIHHNRTTTDPWTGEEYHADEPDLLLWVHCAQQWCTLRAASVYGPTLTPAEQDTFLAEQKAAAKLVGVDVGSVAVPTKVAELNVYMEAQRPKWAYIAGNMWMRDMVCPPGWPRSIIQLIQKITGNAAFDVMTPEMRELYGIHRWSPLRHAVITRAAGLVVKLVGSKMRTAEQLRAGISAHSFGKQAIAVNQKMWEEINAQKAAGSPGGPTGSPS